MQSTVVIDILRLVIDRAQFSAKCISFLRKFSAQCLNEGIAISGKDVAAVRVIGLSLMERQLKEGLEAAVLLRFVAVVRHL